MKKFKIVVLLLTVAAFVTACSCSRKEFTVEFDSNGGSRVQSQTVEKGGKVTKPDDPTKEGYTFDSWKLDGETYDFDSEVTEDLVLVAKWNKKSDDNNSTNNPDANSNEPVASVCTITCDKGYAVNSTNCTCYKLTVTAVNVDSALVDLEKGETHQITASVSPSGVLNKEVTYTSSNSDVATVTSSGLITGVKPGTAYITVKSSDSGKIATIEVRVLDTYTYTVAPVDGSDISYKVTLYKNGDEVSASDAKTINAVYNAAGKYLGRYDDNAKAIIVDKSQIDSVAKLILNNITYKVTKIKAIG